MDFEAAISHAKMTVYTKQELYLRLCALNYLNAMVKKKEYKGLLTYGMFKPQAMRLAIDLAKHIL